MEIPLHLRIHQIEIKPIEVKPIVKDDTRLLLKVTLVATGRPTYQVIYCMNCGKPLGSIEGAEIYEVTDVDDDSWDKGKPRLNIRCNGKFCRTWYRYTLN